MMQKFLNHIFLACLFAALVAAEHLPETGLAYGAMLAVFVGSGVSAAVSRGKIRSWRLLMCLGAGAVFFLAMILLGWMLFGSVRSGILPTGALCLGSGLIVGLFGKKGNGGAKYKVPKMRF